MSYIVIFTENHILTYFGCSVNVFLDFFVTDDEKLWGMSIKQSEFFKIAIIPLSLQR